MAVLDTITLTLVNVTEAVEPSPTPTLSLEPIMTAMVLGLMASIVGGIAQEV